jgi:hypothetical protein
MGSPKINEGKKIKNDPTSMLAGDPTIWTNLSSSKMELVQSWGLGHYGHPQLIFPFENLVFWIYLNFQWKKSFKNQYLLHSKTKSY